MILTILYTSGAAESVAVDTAITEPVAPDVIAAEGWIAMDGPAIEVSYVDQDDVVGFVRVME